MSRVAWVAYAALMVALYVWNMSAQFQHPEMTHTQLMLAYWRRSLAFMGCALIGLIVSKLGRKA